MKRDILEVTVASCIAETTRSLTPQVKGKDTDGGSQLMSFEPRQRRVINACAEAIVERLLSMGVLKGVK
jgi:hypothetical protein